MQALSVGLQAQSCQQARLVASQSSVRLRGNNNTIGFLECCLLIKAFYNESTDNQHLAAAESAGAPKATFG